MSTSFNQSKIDLHNRLLDDHSELQRKIQQLIKNYGKDSADRRLREGYYAGRLKQLRELWQLFSDLDEEVQQAALPTGSDYSSRLVALTELVENYLKIFLDNVPPDELQPTLRSQQEIKSKETPQLTRCSDSCREDVTIWKGTWISLASPRRIG